MTTVRVRHRLLALFLGTLATLAVIEIGLRLGGAGFNLSQWLGNRAAGEAGDALRVLCVGESVTALGGPYAYPAQLQEILNARSEVERFVVLNTGLPGSWSGESVERAAADLPTYRPAYVVAMIGANDHAPPLVDPQAGRHQGWLWDHLRLVRLLRMARWQLSALQTEPGSPAAGMLEHWFQARLAESGGDVPLHYHFGWFLLAHDRPAEALRQFSAALDLDPAAGEAAFAAGVATGRLGRADDAEALIALALELASSNQPIGRLQRDRSFAVHDLADLALLYGRNAAGDLPLALAAAEVATARLPDDPRGWAALARATEAAGDEARAEDAWQRASDLAPGDPEPRVALAHLLALSDPLAAEGALEDALVAAPGAESARLALARLRFDRGAWDEALAALGPIAEGSVQALLLRAGIEEARGRPAEAAQAFDQAFARARDCAAAERIADHLAARGRGAEAADVLDRIALEAGDQATRDCLFALSQAATDSGLLTRAAPRLGESYARLHQLAKAQGATLVAVQYPTLPVAALRRVLPPDPGILVVDNQAPFTAAVRREGYSAVFSDRCYRSFGHGTARGNRLLAERVADAILAAEAARGGH